MALKVNSTTIPTTGTIKCNGTSLTKVVCNGVTVWQKIKSITQSGSFNVSSSSYETKTVTVTFDTPFNSTPTITHSISGGDGSGRFSITSATPSTTKIVFKILHSHGSDHHTCKVNWTATGIVNA